LHSWLVSLGVASADMERVPGSPNSQVIELEVLPPITRSGVSLTPTPRRTYQEDTP